MSEELPAKRSHQGTIRVGEAAKILGVSNSTIQRACATWDANPDADPRPGIKSEWTSPNLGRRDSNGKLMRGRRRVDRASVIAYGVANGMLEPGA